MSTNPRPGRSSRSSHASIRHSGLSRAPGDHEIVTLSVSRLVDSTSNAARASLLPVSSKSKSNTSLSIVSRVSRSIQSTLQSKRTDTSDSRSVNSDSKSMKNRRQSKKKMECNNPRFSPAPIEKVLTEAARTTDETSLPSTSSKEASSTILPMEEELKQELEVPAEKVQFTVVRNSLAHILRNLEAPQKGSTGQLKQGIKPNGEQPLHLQKEEMDYEKQYKEAFTINRNKGKNKRQRVTKFFGNFLSFGMLNGSKRQTWKKKEHRMEWLKRMEQVPVQKSSCTTVRDTTEKRESLVAYNSSVEFEKDSYLLDEMRESMEELEKVVAKEESLLPPQKKEREHQLDYQYLSMRQLPPLPPKTSLPTI